MAKMKLTLVGLYNYDDTLFENMVMPNGINKDDLIVNILERNGDFPVLYPNYDFMKMMIGVWARNCYGVIEKLYNTTVLDYDPIQNYNRTSKISRTGKTNGTGETVNAQTSFNSYDFRNTDKSTSSAEDNMSEDVEENVFGNIGVTTSQQMIEQERNVALFNLYDHIAKDFCNRFCIEIY